MRAPLWISGFAFGVLLSSAPVSAQTAQSDRFIVDLLPGATAYPGPFHPIDVTYPEGLPEGPLVGGGFGAFPLGPTPFTYSVLLTEPDGTISDIAYVTGDAVGASFFDVGIGLISDTEDGGVLDPFGTVVGRLVETGELQDVGSLLAGPVGAAVGLAFPYRVLVSSDVEIPEPAGLAVLALGMLGSSLARRR